MSKQAMKERQKKAELLKAKRRFEAQDLNRRAHWGTGKKIEEYQQAITENVDLQPLEDALDGFSQETVVSENLFDRLANQIDFEALFAEQMIEQLQELVAESFDLGSNRLITTDGDTLSVSFDKRPERLISQLQSQEIYLKNLAEDAQETVRDTIIQGSEEGKSIGEMQDEILNSVEDMTEHRSEVIARSEITEASNNGTVEAAEEAGVEEMMVSASIDRQTCEPGSFSWTSSDSTEYTSCREWDGEIFNLEDTPPIPSSSHPQCRCAVLVTTD